MNKKNIIFLMIFILFGSITLYAVDDIDELMKDEREIYKEKLLKENKEEFKIVDALVEEVYGKVFVKFDNDETWIQITKGDKIKEKTTLITLEKSEVSIKLLNETIVDIKENTRVFFYNLRQSPEKEELTETGMKLFTGKIFSNVKNILNTGSKYEINTGSATAGVRGTKFLVELFKDKQSAITVYEGAVYLTNNETKYETIITKNEKIIVDKNGIFGDRKSHEEKEPSKYKEKTETESENKEEKPLKEEKESEQDLDVDLEWIKENLSEYIQNEEEKEEKPVVTSIKEIIENEEKIEPQEPSIIDNIKEVNDRSRLILTIE